MLICDWNNHTPIFLAVSRDELSWELFCVCGKIQIPRKEIWDGKGHKLFLNVGDNGIAREVDSKKLKVITSRYYIICDVNL